MFLDVHGSVESIEHSHTLGNKLIFHHMVGMVPFFPSHFLVEVQNWHTGAKFLSGTQWTIEEPLLPSLLTWGLQYSAHCVWDDGLAGVKRHSWVNWQALVPDTAYNHTALQVFRFASRHSPSTFTWALGIRRTKRTRQISNMKASSHMRHYMLTQLTRMHRHNKALQSTNVFDS